MSRSVAILALLLSITACRGTGEAKAERVANFQLAGTVQTVQPGDEPNVQTDLPQSTAGQDNSTPREPGSLAVRLETFTNELALRCRIRGNDEVRLYWTTQTRFDPSSILSDLSAMVDNKRIAAAGAIFVVPADDSTKQARPTCVLLAGEIRVEQNSRPSQRQSTPRPESTATSSPLPAPTEAPVVTENPTPPQSTLPGG